MKWYEDSRAIGLRCKFWNGDESNCVISTFSSYKETKFPFFSPVGDYAGDYANIELIQGYKTPYNGKGQPIPDDIKVKVFFDDKIFDNRLSQNYDWKDPFITHYQVLGLEKDNSKVWDAMFDDKPNTIKSGQCYKHLKTGNYYKIEMVALDVTTNDHEFDAVVYSALSNPRVYFTREFTHFLEKFELAEGVKPKTTKLAPDFLTQALDTMNERGKTYDSKEGERSMEKTIIAFNAITGNKLLEEEGWLLMLLLKQVRQWSSDKPHEDSALDSVAYAALLAESLMNGV